jgi:hypothetical protein
MIDNIKDNWYPNTNERIIEGDILKFLLMSWKRNVVKPTIYKTFTFI